MRPKLKRIYTRSLFPPSSAAVHTRSFVPRNAPHINGSDWQALARCPPAARPGRWKPPRGFSSFPPEVGGKEEKRRQPDVRPRVRPSPALCYITPLLFRRTPEGKRRALSSWSPRGLLYAKVRRRTTTTTKAATSTAASDSTAQGTTTGQNKGRGRNSTIDVRSSSLTSSECF